MDLKKKGYIEQKKRDFQKMKESQINEQGERKALPYKNQKTLYNQRVAAQ